MSDAVPPDLVRSLAHARSVVALTGAGVSAESGVPTFRDALEGLWARYDPTELATPDAFARDPALVTRWYDDRRTKLAACAPNAAHRALAELQRDMRAQGRTFTLLTQNVDRLHQLAGSEDVVELHGSLWLWRCVECGEEREERGPAFETHPPRCACGGMRRPGVVWFGEALSEADLAASFEAIESCDLFLSIGTSAVVHPAAGFAQLAQAAGAQAAEINRDPTPISGDVNWSVLGRAGETLPQLMRAAAVAR